MVFLQSIYIKKEGSEQKGAGSAFSNILFHVSNVPSLVVSSRLLWDLVRHKEYGSHLTRGFESLEIIFILHDIVSVFKNDEILVFFQT